MDFIVHLQSYAFKPSFEVSFIGDVSLNQRKPLKERNQIIKQSIDLGDFSIENLRKNHLKQDC